MKKAIQIFICAVLLAGGVWHMAGAAGITADPIIIDAQGQAREIVPASFILTNSSGRMQTLYTFVNNVSAQDGDVSFVAPGEADQSGSLANWITISRAVLNIKPGQQQKVEFSIEVPPVAKPGIYHARISLADGTTRDEAAAHRDHALQQAELGRAWVELAYLFEEPTP